MKETFINLFLRRMSLLIFITIFFPRPVFSILLVNPIKGEELSAQDQQTLFSILSKNTFPGLGFVDNFTPEDRQHEEDISRRKTRDDFLSSGLSEREFASKKVRDAFPGREFDFLEVPTTLYDLHVIQTTLSHDELFSFIGERTYASDPEVHIKGVVPSYFKAAKDLTHRCRQQESKAILKDLLQRIVALVEQRKTKEHFFLWASTELEKLQSGTDTLLTRALETEHKAIEEEKFVLFRATRPKDGFLDYPFSSERISNQYFNGTPTLESPQYINGGIIHSLSFSNSLLSYLFFDSYNRPLPGCTASFYYDRTGKVREHYTVYALPIDKIHLLTKYCSHFYMPGASLGSGIWEAEEQGHPRLRDMVMTAPSERHWSSFGYPHIEFYSGRYDSAESPYGLEQHLDDIIQAQPTTSSVNPYIKDMIQHPYLFKFASYGLDIFDLFRRCTVILAIGSRVLSINERTIEMNSLQTKILEHMRVLWSIFLPNTALPGDDFAAAASAE